MAKEEVKHYEKKSYFAKMFKKVVCCRCIIICLYVGKGYPLLMSASWILNQYNLWRDLKCSTCCMGIERKTNEFITDSSNSFPFANAFLCIWSWRLLKSLQGKKKLLIMISTPFNNYTFIYRDFQNIYLDVLKVLCCRIVVCGKGLKQCVQLG